MKLRDLCATFSALRLPLLDEDAHPDRDSVLELRCTIRDGLAADELLVDCIAHELALIDAGNIRRALTPFYSDPDFGVRFAFGYWPPGSGKQPHEHTAWTISAVCYNQLRVDTYDRGETYRRRELVPRHQFEAPDRAVGYIFEPAVHAPHNPSRTWSLSLHVISPRDGEPVTDFEPLPVLVAGARAGQPRVPDHHPYARVVATRLGRLEADLLARILLATPVPQARELVATCARLASPAVRAVLRSAFPDRFPARAAPRRLARAHPDLCFTLAREAADWTILVDAPSGPLRALHINDFAHDAFAFASTSLDFDVRALPGNLSDEERGAIADTLEEVGLFKEVAA